METIINDIKLKIDDNLLEKKLIDFLRENLDLTGVKNGCGIGVCGSCTVLMNNKTAKSCRLQVKDIIDKQVITIEGMIMSNGSLHPLQQSFIDHGAIQCGFCTPGMILTAHAFLLSFPSPTRAEIRKAISPNLCRCTGYQQIIDAIEAAKGHY